MAKAAILTANSLGRGVISRGVSTLRDGNITQITQ